MTISTYKILISIVFFLVLQFILISLLSYNNYLEQAKSDISTVNTRIISDIQIKNGRWDVQHYNSDGAIPSRLPLYIISSDGFVVDRLNPIQGLLDTSDFNRLIKFKNPQTITGITNENWRVFSSPIVEHNTTVGVITVGRYNPNNSELTSIDSQLKTTVNIIKSKLIYHSGDSIDVSKLDMRILPYNISVQVVNRFNKVLFYNNNSSSISRLPSYIDSSYIYSLLRDGKYKWVTDITTNQSYLFNMTPIYDANKSLLGVVLVGNKITGIFELFKQYAILYLLSTLLSLLLIIPFMVKFIKTFLKQILITTVQNNNKIIPSSVIFNKKESKLYINETGFIIPYASNQYYFCDALFSKPQKRWEVDELIERFGGEMNANNWRKVYDTMNALNKKTEILLNDKLFVVHNKTYKINPIFNAMSSYIKT